MCDFYEESVGSCRSGATYIGAVIVVKFQTIYWLSFPGEVILCQTWSRWSLNPHRSTFDNIFTHIFPLKTSQSHSDMKAILARHQQRSFETVEKQTSKEFPLLLEPRPRGCSQMWSFLASGHNAGLTPAFQQKHNPTLQARRQLGKEGLPGMWWAGVLW